MLQIHIVGNIQVVTGQTQKMKITPNLTNFADFF